eukprot:15333081-Ditylum_brightwellii.AAC.1
MTKSSKGRSDTYLIPAKSSSHLTQRDKRLDANRAKDSPQCFLTTELDQSSANLRKSLWGRVGAVRRRYGHDR